MKELIVYLLIIAIIYPLHKLLTNQPPRLNIPHLSTYDALIVINGHLDDHYPVLSLYRRVYLASQTATASISTHKAIRIINYEQQMSGIIYTYDALELAPAAMVKGFLDIGNLYRFMQKVLLLPMEEQLCVGQYESRSNGVSLCEFEVNSLLLIERARKFGNYQAPSKQGEVQGSGETDGQINRQSGEQEAGVQQQQQGIVESQIQETNYAQVEQGMQQQNAPIQNIQNIQRAQQVIQQMQIQDVQQQLQQDVQQTQQIIEDNIQDIPTQNVQNQQPIESQTSQHIIQDIPQQNEQTANQQIPLSQSHQQNEQQEVPAQNIQQDVAAQNMEQPLQNAQQLQDIIHDQSAQAIDQQVVQSAQQQAIVQDAEQIMAGQNAEELAVQTPAEEVAQQNASSQHQQTNEEQPRQIQAEPQQIIQEQQHASIIGQEQHEQMIDQNQHAQIIGQEQPIQIIQVQPQQLLEQQVLEQQAGLFEQSKQQAQPQNNHITQSTITQQQPHQSNDVIPWPATNQSTQSQQPQSPQQLQSPHPNQPEIIQTIQQTPISTSSQQSPTEQQSSAVEESIQTDSSQVAAIADEIGEINEQQQVEEGQISEPQAVDMVLANQEISQVIIDEEMNTQPQYNQQAERDTQIEAVDEQQLTNIVIDSPQTHQENDNTQSQSQQQLAIEEQAVIQPHTEQIQPIKQQSAIIDLSAPTAQTEETITQPDELEPQNITLQQQHPIHQHHTHPEQISAENIELEQQPKTNIEANIDVDGQILQQANSEIGQQPPSEQVVAQIQSTKQQQPTIQQQPTEQQINLQTTHQTASPTPIETASQQQTLITNTDQIVQEQTKIEQTKLEQVKGEEVKVEQVKGEQVKGESVKAQEKGVLDRVFAIFS